MNWDRAVHDLFLRQSRLVVKTVLAKESLMQLFFLRVEDFNRENKIEKTIATVITHLGCYECRLYSVHVVRRESELMSIRVHNAYCYMWYINTSFGNSAINIQK